MWRKKSRLLESHMTETKILESTPFIGERIRQGIKLSGKSQRDVAAAIGVTEPWLSTIINGRQNPSLDLIENLSSILEQPMAFFFPLYSLEGMDDEKKKLATSIFDDTMDLTVEYLKALKVITNAMHQQIKGKSE